MPWVWEFNVRKSFRNYTFLHSQDNQTNKDIKLIDYYCQMQRKLNQTRNAFFLSSILHHIHRHTTEKTNCKLITKPVNINQIRITITYKKNTKIPTRKKIEQNFQGFKHQIFIGRETEPTMSLQISLSFLRYLSLRRG